MSLLTLNFSFVSSYMQNIVSAPTASSDRHSLWKRFFKLFIKVTFLKLSRLIAGKYLLNKCINISLLHQAKLRCCVCFVNSDE